MSLVIDADSEYLTSGAFDPGLTTAFAVGCWVKMGNQSAGWKPIANMYLNGEPTITHILLSVNGDHYDSWHYPQSGSERLDAGGTTSTSSWQWVVMEYNQATPKSAMRLNGTETQTASTDRGSYRDLIDRIRVGMTDTSMLSAGTVYGRMKLAHLTVWKRTLTGGEHTSAASGVNPQDIGASDIVFYAEFDEDATVTIGSTSFTATGSPTYDGADNPTVDAPAGGAFTLTSDQGSYSLTGQSASLLFNRKLTADYGTHSLTGQDVGLLLNRLVSAAQGSYSLTGQDATLTYTQPGVYSLTADSGTYNWTVSDAFADYTMVALHGTYDLTGQDATLTLTGAPPQDYVMSVDAGYYSLTGRAVALRGSNAPIVPSSGKGLSLSMRIGL